MSGWSEVIEKNARLINGKLLTQAQARLAAEKVKPECDHDKQQVEVEIMPGPDYLPGTRLLCKGRYCPTCYRLYAWDGE